MHTTFFTGRLLSADDFQAEQSYLRPPHAQAHAGSGSLLDRIALNPQPLPPKSAVEQLVSSLPPSLLDTVALNPQPLPPKAFDAVALNPQPLPPKHFDAVALNPQPLPPRESLGDAAELDMMQLQSLMSQRQQVEQLVSNVVKKMDDTANGIVGKIK